MIRFTVVVGRVVDGIYLKRLLFEYEFRLTKGYYY